jgi:GNAT superfamily N-acetyltransferase
VAGHSEGWRFAADVAAQREEGWSLREQLLWRASQLGDGEEIDLAAHVEHFPELIDGYSIDGISPVLRGRGANDEMISKVSLQSGGSLRLTGMLRQRRDYVGFFMRRLQLQEGWAIHQRLVIDPSFRGGAIGSRFLQRSLELYDELELQEVKIRAGLQTGRWLWAHLGFEFALPAEAEQACEWAEEVCAVLDIEINGVDEIEEAGQLARLECEKEVSLAALAEAMPRKREDLEQIATDNAMAMERLLPLGQLVMLSGPEWHGYLRLKGAQRLAFEEAVAERVALANRGSRKEE